MKKETKKTVDTTAKKKDIVENNNTDVVNETKPDAVVEIKPDAAPKSKSLIIKLEDLKPFKDHPYLVREGAELDDLTESIGVHGILNPLLVRPLEGEDGKYEIISGHRRYAAAQKLGLKKVPCTVHFIDRDAATVMMVDSNCQRTELLPSEKAKAYKMKLDALNRQGKRTDLTFSPLDKKLENGKKLAETVGESQAQIYRFVRLTYLVPELLQYVDEGKIGMRPAVEISYLDEEVQRDIVDRIIESDDTVFPSHAQTRRIREKAAEGEISYEDVKAIMDERKPNQVEKLKIPTEELRTRIGKNMTDEAFIKYLFTAVDYYKKYLERNREQGAR
ncbi:MAG: ParB/RepB/Spo0J family partition protein [Clostridia bacterium]|nr:ParB/RepB/Spo0J family partition protein [Clostridia bacterium]